MTALSEENMKKIIKFYSFKSYKESPTILYMIEVL